MNEPVRHVVVERVDWRRLFAFPRITSALPLAMQPTRIVMGLAIVVVLMVSGTLWDWATGPAVGPAGIGSAPMTAEETLAALEPILYDEDLVDPQLAARVHETGVVDFDELRDEIVNRYRSRAPEIREAYVADVERALAALDYAEPRPIFASTVRAVTDTYRAMAADVTALNFADAVARVVNFEMSLTRRLWTHHRFFLAAFGLWTVAVVFLGGGAIARSVACEFAVAQYVSWPEALGFSLRRAGSILATLVLPVAALATGVLALTIGGLLFRVPVLNVVAALALGIALFGGFIAVLLLVLTVLAMGLFVPAIAAEGSDAPDALARGFSYVKNRPLHYLLYVGLALLIGVIGVALAILLAEATIQFVAWGAGLAAGERAEAIIEGTRLLDAGPTERLAAGIAGIWRALIWGLVAGFGLSYAFSAWTVVYFLLRKATDDQDFDELWLPGMINGSAAPSRAASDAGQQ